MAFGALRRLLLRAGLCLFALSPVSVQALESAPQISPRATVTLVSEAASVAPGQTFRIGLRQKLSPGWHTYWKNPGDSGQPPEMKLAMPDGARAGAMQFPGPDRFQVGPAMSYGYENEVVFPLTVTVPQTLKPGERFAIKAEAEWLVCEKECIPEEGAFMLDLPVGTPSPAGVDVLKAIQAAEARLPVAAPWNAKLSIEDKALALSVEGDGLSAASVKKAYYYPETWGVVSHPAPQQLSVSDNRLALALEKGLTFNPKNSLAGLLAITDGGGQTRWFEISPSLGVASFALEQLPLWQAVLFAFLGGLILNLMPCVFPVLAIKATSVARLSHGSLKEIRLSGLYYTLGVMTAFVALASVLLALRAAGGAVGWGFQFQSPLFVAAMSWLLLAVGLNLSGVYEIGLGITGTGQKLTHREGHVGSYFTGLLAVIVATPCTAPFMGAAIGTALTAPVILCIAIFIAMGIGLALPYALLGIFPRVARMLPRPGVWMLRLRQAMAFPMYASAAWLAWVLTQQAGDSGLLLVLAGAILVSFSAWVYGFGQHGGGRGILPRGVAAAAMIGALALLPALRNAEPPVASASQQAALAFTNARLEALRKEGKAVFVNMTAAWCITCLVNERTTLSTSRVQEAFERGGVTYLKGDWTNRDPEISAYLRSFNRDGLPFYAFYPAGGGEPVILPPVLTESMVLDELNRNSRQASNQPSN
jgi:thiol:disulfide interchange protein